jgi:hypothetical protein
MITASAQLCTPSFNSTSAGCGHALHTDQSVKKLSEIQSTTSAASSSYAVGGAAVMANQPPERGLSNGGNSCANAQAHLT